MADRELKVIISGDPSSLQRAFKKSGDGANKLGSAFLKVGKAAAVAGAAIGAAAVVGIGKAIDAASDLGEQLSKTSVVFGDSGKEIHKWSEGLASSFGLSQRAALEAAGTFGNMLVPMGFSRKEAGKLSKQFVELGADMASFNNASPAETLDALRAGLAGETEPLRRFGVFLNDARIKAEAASQGFKLVKGQLDPMAKAAATAAIIMKDTADTQGDFERTSGSLANQQRILKAELENAAAAAGTALLPAATKVMQLLAQGVPIISEFATKLSQAVAPHIVAAIDQLGPAFTNVKQTVTELIDTARNLLPVLQQIASPVVSFGMSSLGQSFGAAAVSMLVFHSAAVRVVEQLTKLQAAAKGATLASLISPVGLLTAGVGLLAFAFYKTRIASDDVTTALDTQRAAVDRLKSSNDDLAHAQQRLTDANISLKQASLDVTTALKRRNQLEQEGKRGTDEFKQAQLDVQRAYSNRRRAELEVKDSSDSVKKSTVESSASMKQLRTSASQLTADLGKVASGLGKVGEESKKKTLVQAYAQEMNKLAKQSQAVAEKTKETNPQISQAAAKFAQTAKAAADYAKRTGEIPPSLEKAVAAAGPAGRRVGASFGDGIKAGIDSRVGAIAAAAANAVTQAEAAARARARAKSPSELFAELGRDISDGIRKGMVEKYALLKEAGKTAVDQVISATVSQIQARKGAFSEAFGNLVSAALSAFDALHDGVKTAAEKALEAFDLRQAKIEAQKRIQELKDELQKAAQELAAFQAKGPELVQQREGESPEDFAARQLAAQEQFNEEQKRLTEQRNAAQLALDEELEAQRLAKQRAALEKKAQLSREKEDDQTALERYQFEKRLLNLQTQLEKGKITQKQFLQKLHDLYKEFDIPFTNRGKALGLAVAAGLNDAEKAVTKAARQLVEILEKAFEKVEIAIDVQVRGQKQPEHRAMGGPVRYGQPYLVGERGAELFVPDRSGKIIPAASTASAMSGGGTYVFNFPNYLGDKRDLEKSLQQMMRRFEDSNGISFTGRQL